MHAFEEQRLHCRRHFLTTSASGLGTLALTSLLVDDGLLGAAAVPPPVNAQSPKQPHFTPRAKACIFILLAGGPSQAELFDPKPLLNERHGKKMPASILKDVEFAFIKKEEAVLKGTGTKFRQC